MQGSLDEAAGWVIEEATTTYCVNSSALEDMVKHGLFSEIDSITTNFGMPKVLHSHPSDYNPNPSHDTRQYDERWIIPDYW